MNEWKIIQNIRLRKKHQLTAAFMYANCGHICKMIT